MMKGWRHSGFNVFCSPRIQPCEEEAMENLARYIIRASFSQERMTYIPEESRKNWARSIQKIYEVNPLTCPKCSASQFPVSDKWLYDVDPEYPEAYPA